MKEEKKYFVEKIQDARDIVKNAGEDPNECNDLVIAVFNKFVEADEIHVLTEILREIRDLIEGYTVESG